MWLLILYKFFNILFSYLSRPFSHFFVFLFHLLSFTLLATRHYNLKRLIWFYYNLHSIIFAIFQTKNFNFLNWKISQLKCIFLTKLTYILKHFISTGEKLFLLRKGLELIPKTVHQKCTKSAQVKARKIFLLHRYLCLW